jgi:hypothetical protein
MARRKSPRSQLYRAARDLGNIEAAEKGPASYGKRVVRRKVDRKTNSLTRSVLKGVRVEQVIVTVLYPAIIYGYYI